MINKEATVRDSTREKIQKIIDETGYRPNIYARNLGSKLDKNILISISKERGALTTRWINILMDEIIPYLNEYGFSILIEECYDNEDIKKSMLNNSSTFIDGAIIFYEGKNDERIKLIEKYNIPFVIFGDGTDDKKIYISNENFQGSKQGVDYLLSRKIKTIDLLLGSMSLTNENREKGAKNSYLEKNEDLCNLKVTYDLTSPQKVYDYIIARGKEGKIPQGIFVSGDEKAIGALKALEDLGKKVPEDVSVMGFDDLPISKFYSPALTTVAQNYKRLGEEITKKIFNLINGEDEESIKVENKLIIRESVK